MMSQSMIINGQTDCKGGDPQGPFRIWHGGCGGGGGGGFPNYIVGVEARRFKMPHLLLGWMRCSHHSNRFSI